MSTHEIDLTSPAAVAIHMTQLALDLTEADIALERTIYSDAPESAYAAARSARRDASRALFAFRNSVLEANR